MISSTIDMEKLLTFVRSLTVKHSFKAVALSFLLAAAFLFSSVCAYAQYNVASAAFIPVALPALGADAYTVATLIAGMMGVDLSYDNYNAVMNMNMFSPAVLPTSDSMLWVKHVGSGIVQFGLNKFGYDYLSSVSSDFIVDNNIQDNASGSISSSVSYSFDGFTLSPLNGSSSYFFAETGTAVASGGTFSTTGNPYAVAHDSTVYCYYNGNFIGSTYLNIINGHTFHVGLGCYNDQPPTVSIVRGNNSYFSSTVPIPGASSPVRVSSSSSYSSGVIDTSIGSSLPSTGGAVISFPYSGPEDTQLALEELTRLVLSGDSNVSISLSDDVGVPEVFTQTIADTPYSSLSGTLSGISSFLNTISSSVSGIAESIVGADSTFFGNIVSALATPFEPVFAVFRSGVGIWRYVVSWVGTISAPFTWSLSALGSAGSYFLSPIYAAAAAAVVLAVYKKFGR